MEHMSQLLLLVREDKKILYIERKGIITQNVMAACDFDLLFTFIMAGWEGAAHDTISKFFKTTIRYNIFFLLIVNAYFLIYYGCISYR